MKSRVQNLLLVSWGHSQEISPYNNLVCVTSFNSLKNLSTWKSFECTIFSFFLTDPSSLQSYLFVSLPYQASLKIPFFSSLSPYNNLVCVTSFNSLKNLFTWKSFECTIFSFFWLTPPRCNLFFSCPFLIKRLLKSFFLFSVFPSFSFIRSPTFYFNLILCLFRKTAMEFVLFFLRYFNFF